MICKITISLNNNILGVFRSLALKEAQKYLYQQVTWLNLGEVLKKRAKFPKLKKSKGCETAFCGVRGCAPLLSAKTPRPPSSSLSQIAFSTERNVR